MHWKPIVVGVDSSPESVLAAELGALIARRAGTDCHLVHAAPDYWAALSMPGMQVDLTELDEAAVTHARELVQHSLEPHVSPDLVRDLSVKVGRAPVVLADEARRLEAEVVVLGGKHHRGLARLGGSTLTHVVRLGSVPMLAIGGQEQEPREIRRVLVAVDLSYAAKPAIDTAERWAGLFDARLRVMHVVEPMPIVPGFSLRVAEDEVYRTAERQVDIAISPLVTYPEAEVVVRRGRSASAIVTEAQQWHADLLVLGSHGKGWVDRLLIGSTSERMLQLLPAPTLVIPVAKPGGRARDLAAELPWEIHAGA